MNTKYVRAAGALCLAVAAVLAVPALAYAAQGEPGGPNSEGGPNLWGLEGDVDLDGLVNATDVQHVINRALGLPTTDPNGNARPIHRYVVGSPRASLAPHPPVPTEVSVEPVPCPVIGAACNFARPDGRIMVRLGTPVVFMLDHNIEGVWYPRACGLLGTQLVVEATREVNPGEITEWVELGHDGAQGQACGPRVGTARVLVAHRFTEAGDVLVRARMLTRAIPMAPVDDVEGEGSGDPEGLADPSEIEGELEPIPLEELPCGAAVAYDEVYIHVRVVAVEPGQPDVVQWQEVPDPVMRIYGGAIPHELAPVETPGE